MVMTAWRAPVTAIIRSLLGLALACAATGWLALLFPPLDLINQFLPIWFCLGVGAILILDWLGGWRVGLFLVSAVLTISCLPLAREISAYSAGTLSPSRPLTIVQFNVFKENETPHLVSNWIKEKLPDIVTLEETLGPTRQILEQLHSYYPYQTSCLAGMRCSTVIISRERPLASGGLAQGDPENRRALSAVWATFAVGGKQPFTVVAVHMVRPWPWGDQGYGRRELAKFLRTIDTRRTIVTGDFNSTPWTLAMRSQDRLFGLERHTRLLATWPAVINGVHTPAIMPIDHLYAGAQWNLGSIARGPYLGSDHLPIIATLYDATLPLPPGAISVRR